MATRVIDDTKLNDIAVAIQAKDSGGQMTVDEMPTRIEALPTTLIPKTITENGVYNASSDNADGYDVVTVDVPEKNTFDEYYAGTLEVANIPSARIIMDYMFSDATNLIDVIMPNVTTIKPYAFRNCTNLALTSLPSGVTYISGHAFRNCTNLALTSLPSGVTYILGHAFEGCINLALTSLPSGVTYILEHAFEGCINLALTSLPSGLTRIGTCAFQYCTHIPYLDFSDFTQIPTLDANAFDNTTFPFYFRDQQQLDEWAAATNWSSLANRFQIKPSEANQITQAKDTIGGTALYNGTGYKQDYRWDPDNTDDNGVITGVPNKFAVGYIELEPGDVVHFYGDILKGTSGGLTMHIQSSSNTRLVRASLSNWSDYTNRSDIMAYMTDIDYDTTTKTLHSFKWTGGTNAVKGYMHLSCVGIFTEGITVVTINEE